MTRPLIIHCTDENEYRDLMAYREVREGRNQRNAARRGARPPRVNNSRSYEKRLAGHIMKETERHSPGRIYTNAEFEVFVQKNGDSYAGVGPTIKYMRDVGLLSGTRGRHKLDRRNMAVLET